MILLNNIPSKYEIQDDPKMNDIVFNGGTKYTSRKGNRELELTIDQTTDKYLKSDNKTKRLIVEKIYTELNNLCKGRKYLECSDGKFNGRYIKCIKGKLFSLCDKKNVYSCLRTTSKKITNEKVGDMQKRKNKSGKNNIIAHLLNNND